jgi:hypothetical protein
MMWDTRQRSMPTQKTKLTVDGHAHPVYRYAVVAVASSSSLRHREVGRITGHVAGIMDLVRTLCVQHCDSWHEPFQRDRERVHRRPSVLLGLIASAGARGASHVPWH